MKGFCMSPQALSQHVSLFVCVPFSWDLSPHSVFPFNEPVLWPTTKPVDFFIARLPIKEHGHFFLSILLAHVSSSQIP